MVSEIKLNCLIIWYIMRTEKNRICTQKSSKQFEVKVIKSQSLLLYNLQCEYLFFF